MIIKMVKYSKKYTQYRTLLLDMIHEIDRQHGQNDDSYLPEDSFLQKSHYLFLCENQVIGFISLRRLKEDKSVDINSFYLRKEYRGKKLGKACLLLAIKYCKNRLHSDSVILGVYASNTIAYNLYKSVGFTDLGYTLKVKSLNYPISSNFRFYENASKNDEIFKRLIELYRTTIHKYDYNTLFIGTGSKFNFSILLDNKENIVAGSISFVMEGDTGNKFLYVSYYPVAINKKYLTEYLKQVLSYKNFDFKPKNKWMSVASEIYPEAKKFGKLQSILLEITDK